MKAKNIISSILAGLLAAACASNHGAGEKKESQAILEAQAKISKTEAEKIALAKVPNGTVKEGELEKENGKLIWSFDIASPGSKDITEVQVDAVTGEVLSIQKETPADQEKEKKEKK